MTKLRDARLERRTTIHADELRFARRSHRLDIDGICARCPRGETRPLPR